jgi:hypothetical protein
VTPSAIDRLLRPLHRWVWQNPHRRGRKLLRFAETEADGGRDLSRAAELTADPLLRRLYLRHAQDEQRHAELFRVRGRQVLKGAAVSTLEVNWLAPGERGLDDLRVDRTGEDSLLAFLHLSEKAAAGRFTLYESVLGTDEGTRAVFRDILGDEVFHMSYTRSQLARIAPRKQGLRLWQARATRVWKLYLRLATALASVLGTLLLRLQYFLILPLFALLARRAARREPEGFSKSRPPDLASQY